VDSRTEIREYLDLAFEAMDLPVDLGLTLTAYGAEPGSPAQDALRLAGWAATPEPTTIGKDRR
jgi:hypothetical protein